MWNPAPLACFLRCYRHSRQFGSLSVLSIEVAHASPPFSAWPRRRAVASVRINRESQVLRGAQKTTAGGLTGPTRGASRESFRLLSLTGRPTLQRATGGARPVPGDLSCPCCSPCIRLQEESPCPPGTTRVDTIVALSRVVFFCRTLY